MKALRQVYLTAFILAALFISCNKTETTVADSPHVREMKSAEKAILASSNQFCFDYFAKLSQEEAGANAMFSPYSAHAALSMLIHGASGTTKQEIKDALRISAQSDEDVKVAFKSLKEYLLQVDKSVNLNIANSIWSRQELTVKPSFNNTMTEFYQAQIKPLDFANPLSVKTINSWVNDQTAGRIPTIIDKLNPEDVMVLLNAVYFKSDWKTKFDASKTAKASFTKDDKSIIQVDMMQSDKMEAWLHYDAEYQMVDIPFGNGGYSYTVIMPQGSKTLDDMVVGFTNEKWQALLAQEKGSSKANEQIRLKMPKFKFAYEKSMVKTLQMMGMNKAFTDAAELSELFVEPLSLIVSNVKQKAYIQVDEQGGEAAAVTSITVGTTSVGIDYITVDRPFLFLIREKNSNTILFIGKVHQPQF